MRAKRHRRSISRDYDHCNDGFTRTLRSKAPRRPKPVSQGKYMRPILLVAVGQLWIILPLDRSPDVVRDYPGSSGGWFAFQWWIQSVFESVEARVVSRNSDQPSCRLGGYLISAQNQSKFTLCRLLYLLWITGIRERLAWLPGSFHSRLFNRHKWWRVLGGTFPLGLLVVLLTGHIWVIAMLCGHHQDGTIALLSMTLSATFRWRARPG